MPIPFADPISPNGPFGIVEDSDVKGGLHAVADDTARNSITIERQKLGMHVYVASTGATWILTSTGTPPLSDLNFKPASGLQLLSGAKPTGAIIVDNAGLGSVNVLDGETFTLNDGVNPAVVFEFDNNSSVVQTPTLRQVDITGAATASDVSVAIAAAINSAPTLDINADDGGGSSGNVSLSNTTSGSAGNIAITETVVDSDFVVSGMSGGSAGRSYLIQGLELIPAINRVFSGGTYYTCPQFRVRPGVMSFPNGRVGSVNSSLVLNLRSGATLGTVVNSVWGFSSFNSTTSNIYFYLFLRFAPGDSDVTLVWSQYPPDSSGRPRHWNPTPPALPVGTTVDDYAYVGMLIARDDLISSVSADTTAGLTSKIWGGCSVITLGNGVREVGVAVADAANQTAISSINGTYENTNTKIGVINFTTAFDPDNLAGGSSGRYGRCRAARISVGLSSRIRHVNVAGSFSMSMPLSRKNFVAGYATVTGVSLVPFVDASFNYKKESFQSLMHTQKVDSHRISCRYDAVAGSGEDPEAEISGATAIIVSVVEDVNNLQTSEYSQTKWPDLS